MSKSKECGHKFILRGDSITEGYDVTSMVVVAPTERRFINKRSPFKEIGGYSKEIFTMLGTKAFPLDLKNDLYLPFSAKYYDYTIAPTPMRVIHLVSPILLDKENKASHRRILKEAYANIFFEFLQNSRYGDILRMGPLGLEDNQIIFNDREKMNKLVNLRSAYVDEMKEKIDFTVECLFQGLTNAEKKARKRCSHIELFTSDMLFFYGLENKLKKDGIPLISDV